MQGWINLEHKSDKGYGYLSPIRGRRPCGGHCPPVTPDWLIAMLEPVVEILDFEVKYLIGFFFSSPNVVREIKYIRGLEIKSWRLIFGKIDRS